MTVLVQRSYQVALDRQGEFERLCAERRWPELEAQGVAMVGYGNWTFGGRLDEVCAHLAYADLAHLEAVHEGGSLTPDVPDELLPLIGAASARVIELSDDLGGIEVQRSEGYVPTAALPVAESGGFGRHSIISERSYLVAANAQAQFLQLSHDLLWPWLVQHGARMVGFGRDPFGPSEHLVTLFAFRSLFDWYRLSRPEPGLSPPDEMVEGWQQRSALIQRHSGRLLTVASDYGAGSS